VKHATKLTYDYM